MGQDATSLLARLASGAITHSLHTVTTDLIAGQSVAGSKGDVVNAILESINLPVHSAPIARDGMLLVDGGILNNLPADLLVQQGCDLVIGVDVAARIEQRVGSVDAETPTSEVETPARSRPCFVAFVCKPTT